MKFKILALSIMTLASGAWASPPTGQSSLKLESPVRTARKSLASVEFQITSLDQDIVLARNQSASRRALPGSNGSAQVAMLDAYTTALEIQKRELSAEREQLQSELSSAD